MTAPDPAPPLDADAPTTHIRCGSDLRQKLRDAGFVGGFLEYSDPICQGPVPDIADIAPVRARFIARYGAGAAATEAALRTADAALAEAAASPGRLVLWCEHDAYDQLLLARVLAALPDRAPDHAGLDLICIGQHPSIERFIGLGQLTPPHLRALWPRRTPITPAHTSLGRAVWHALRQPTPKALHAIATAGTPPVPPMAAALLRHLQDLPWATDGLSLTERLVLQAVQDGAGTMGEVFAAWQRLDPLPCLGDIMITPIIEDLATTATPAVFLGEAAPWPQHTVDRRTVDQRTVALADFGTAVLAGQGDWQAASPPERWVGGIRIAPGAPAWRWSDAGPLLAPP